MLAPCCFLGTLPLPPQTHRSTTQTYNLACWLIKVAAEAFRAMLTDKDKTQVKKLGTELLADELTGMSRRYEQHRWTRRECSYMSPYSTQNMELGAMLGREHDLPELGSLPWPPSELVGNHSTEDP